MKINKWYKNIVESNNESPPEVVWEEIQNHLDVDTVWTRIDTSLSNQATKKKRIAAFAIAATLFLTVSTLGLWYILSTYSIHDTQPLVILEPEAEQFTDENEEEDEIEYPDLSSNQEVLTAFVQDETEYHAIIEAQLPAIYPEYETHPVDSFILKADHTPVSIPMLLADLQIHNETFKTISYNPSNLGNQEIMSYTGDAVWAGSIHSSVFIGFTGHLANTWLLNDKTFTGLKSDELTFTDPSFGSNFGIHMGMGVTNRLGLRGEFLWVSRNRQTYREYISGNFVSNDLILDYYMLKLLARYNAGSNLQPHYLLAGAYTGLMQQATQVINGFSQYVDSEYENLDYGLILGYEYPVPLGGRLIFTPGVFVKMGMINIFSGNENIPYYLNRTHNASFNLSFSISYSFY
ncbi:MAG: hypothetical protein EA393_07120 [Bacteroidetes bacterium]|nr:MAG: hypothetical protein EA393_07120 [Bacteroidota bacterium]